MLRMDSMMISSSCKKLSRIELVYTVNLNLIKKLNKTISTSVSQELQCYLKEVIKTKPSTKPEIKMQQPSLNDYYHIRHY